MDIRPETPSDHAAVQALLLAAFEDQGELVAAMTADLRAELAPDDGLALVAEEHGQVIGYALFTSNLLDAPRQLLRVPVLSPLAVLPDHQRQGVGGTLLRHSLELLRQRGVPVVLLEGSPGYYPRFGFRPGAELGFRKPSLRIPDAAFQALLLPAHEPWMTGTLVYNEVFWRHDAVGLRDAPATT